MAGTAGFEPTDGGIKNRCLTAWRRPNFKLIAEKNREFKKLCEKQYGFLEVVLA